MIMEEINKEEFIGKYLDKHMKNHNLPMGMQYYALLGATEEKAEKAYKAKIKKLTKTKKQNGTI